MGYLLKEALKTLCGLNQWSYAVFWQIGCQNPKLLIWEECYHEPITCSALPRIPVFDSPELAFGEWEGCWVSAETRTRQFGVQTEAKVNSLINKMMMGNRVNIVGEGLIGRAAFTGNHLWILSENYARETHPPEVQNEVFQQFSFGMKTIVVIPVLSHGVVQLGSSLAITENMAFVNDVKSLILQLGCIPGALLSDNYTSNESAPKIGAPVCVGNFNSSDPSGSYMLKDSVQLVSDSFNHQNISSQALKLIGQPNSLSRSIAGNLQGISSSFQCPKLAQNASPNGLFQPNLVSVMKPSLPCTSQFENGEIGAEVTPSNPELWLNHLASSYGQRSDELPFAGSSSKNHNNLQVEEQILSNLLQGHLSSSLNTSTSQPRTNGGSLSSNCQFYNEGTSNSRSILIEDRLANHGVSCANHTGDGVNSSKMEVSSPELTDQLTSNDLPSGNFDVKQHSKEDVFSQIEVAQGKEIIENDLFQSLNNLLAHSSDSQKHEFSNHSPSSGDAKYKDELVQSSSGDDLFDIFGADFKNKLFSGGSWNNILNDGLDKNTKTSGENKFSSLTLQDADSDLCSVSSGIFSAAGTDHLLDAVVKKGHTAAKRTLDNSVSCRTTLAKINSSSVSNASCSFGRVGSDKLGGNSLGIPKSLANLGAVGSCSFKSEPGKEDEGNYSQTSSLYGSQISSWVEQGHSMKHSSSASTGYSKRPDEVAKSNRKRLKPGENPRPRPKDRQMIQDRMKELREIVPNGAKCSIDALLERTIKHMLFLQSVTKHADKLKQTGESKIISKDGGLLLRDNFEGGRTWAYEVGSQSMVCPIMVEDLNQPRQMLVEMLCEERGLFLEIADIIRGLGLTILKGVMETRNDKIWARFAVEANRDVTRMEIFLSLVHLLEHTVKSSAGSSHGVENETMMVPQSFHQAACSIPATGQPF